MQDAEPESSRPDSDLFDSACSSSGEDLKIPDCDRPQAGSAYSSAESWKRCTTVIEPDCLSRSLPAEFQSFTMGKSSSSIHDEEPLRTSPSLQSHPTREELRALGKSLRDKCPRQDHAVWQPPTHRPDAVSLLVESNKGDFPS